MMLVSDERMRDVEDARTATTQKNANKNNAKSLNSSVQRSDQRLGESQLVVDQIYTGRASEMFLLEDAGSEPPIMLMKVSYELACKIEDQLSAGLAYQRERNMSMSKLEEELRMNRLMRLSVKHRVQGMMKLKGDRQLTVQEQLLAQRLRQEARDTDMEIERIELKKKTLLQDIELARRIWENAALPVENSLQDVFVRCGLYDEAKAIPRSPVAVQSGAVKRKPSSEKHQPPDKAAEDELLGIGRASIIIKETRARRELYRAQRQHDQHRDSFRPGLAAYIVGAVDRPDVTRHLLEEEFSRNYFRAGSELAQIVTRAEAAHEALLSAAAEAQITIIDPEDDMSPNIPYDIDEHAAVKIKNLDHDAIEVWKEDVIADAKPNLRPAGHLLHMAERWKRALEADEDVSSSGVESVSVSDAGVENHQDSLVAHDSMLKPVSQGKLEKVDRYLSVSERAQGKARRRIEDCMRKMRPIEP